MVLFLIYLDSYIFLWCRSTHFKEVLEECAFRKTQLKREEVHKFCVQSLLQTAHSPAHFILILHMYTNHWKPCKCFSWVTAFFRGKRRKLVFQIVFQRIELPCNGIKTSSYQLKQLWQVSCRWAYRQEFGLKYFKWESNQNNLRSSQVILFHMCCCEKSTRILGNHRANSAVWLDMTMRTLWE